MIWSWTKLSSPQWEDAWSERIAGNPNAVIEKLKGGKTIRITVYVESEEDAYTLKEYFGGSVREIKTRDWVASQARAKRPPLKIRGNLLITEQTDAGEISKLRDQYPGRAIITVPAEMAFGTGDHATTSTCLRLVSDFARSRRNSSWSMTDVGCGTGVLALAAVKLGASRASAFDFDQTAVEVARQNAERNGVDGQALNIFQADVLSWSPRDEDKGDLVVANLFSSILQRAFPAIVQAMKPGGALVVSGILADQWAETKAAARLSGLAFSHVIRKGKWVTALGNITDN